MTRSCNCKSTVARIVSNRWNIYLGLYQQRSRSARNRLALLALLFFTVPAYADVATGLTELRLGLYVAALHELLPYADSGDNDVQMALGYLYDFSPHPDPRKAMAIYRAAAERGVPEATYMLGFQSYKGLGTERNPTTAARYFREAAALGQPDAELALALLYLRGEGVEKDPVESKVWQDQVRQQRPGENPFADIHPYRPSDRRPETAMGEFRAREFSSAFRDLLPYADSSDSEIQMALGYLYDFKSPPEPEKAAEIFRKAAARGVPEATYMLGFQSYKGLGVSRDPVAAAKYFEQAAALGEHDAKLALAYLYLNGEGVEKDLARSKNWQDQAEQDGVVGPRAPLVAPYRPGYYFKKGSRHDDAELEKIRTEGAVYGAEQGDIFSLYTLANQISHGLAPGVSTQDLTNWTRRAADSGEADAMWMMAIGLSTTLEEREMWLQKGANLWDIDAMLMLSQLERNKKPPNLVEAYKYCTLYSLGKNPNTQLPAHDCVEWANPGPAGDEAVASFLRDSPRPEGAEHRTHISDLH